jgi:hypothetical protein
MGYDLTGSENAMQQGLEQVLGLAEGLALD